MELSQGTEHGHIDGHDVAVGVLLVDAHADADGCSRPRSARIISIAISSCVVAPRSPRAPAVAARPRAPRVRRCRRRRRKSRAFCEGCPFGASLGRTLIRSPICFSTRIDGQLGERAPGDAVVGIRCAEPAAIGVREKSSPGARSCPCPRGRSPTRRDLRTGAGWPRQSDRLRRVEGARVGRVNSSRDLGAVHIGDDRTCAEHGDINTG